MPSVMFYGGCVIRDAYNLMKEDVELGGYVARQSLISATTPPVKGLPKPVLESDFQTRMVTRDLQSSLMLHLERAAERDIDLVVMDCHIERVGVHDMGKGRYITRSSELKRSKILDSLPKQPRLIRVGTNEHTNLYQQAAKTLTAKLKELGLVDRFIVVDAPWATRDSDGQPFKEYLQRPVQDVSNDISHLTGILKDEGLQVITLPEEHQIGDANHRFSRSPLHFVPEAPAWIAQQIRASI